MQITINVDGTATATVTAPNLAGVPAAIVAAAQQLGWSVPVAPPVPTATAPLPALVGFPAGSVLNAHAMGTPPSVTTPDGRVIVATTQAQADGSIAFVPAAAAAVTVAPASTYPLIGFPAGSILRPGNVMGSMPTVVEPDGTVVEAMVGVNPAGGYAFVPFVAPAPNPTTPAEAAQAAASLAIAESQATH